MNGEVRPLTVVRCASVCGPPVIAGDICRLSLSPQRRTSMRGLLISEGIAPREDALGSKYDLHLG